ncbi:hypothetical protein STEG23_013275 [Scotinomys teguina]
MHQIKGLSHCLLVRLLLCTKSKPSAIVFWSDCSYAPNQRPQPLSSGPTAPMHQIKALSHCLLVRLLLCTKSKASAIVFWSDCSYAPNQSPQPLSSGPTAPMHQIKGLSHYCLLVRLLLCTKSKASAIIFWSDCSYAPNQRPQPLSSGPTAPMHQIKALSHCLLMVQAGSGKHVLLCSDRVG